MKNRVIKIVSFILGLILLIGSFFMGCSDSDWDETDNYRKVSSDSSEKKYEENWTAQVVGSFWPLRDVAFINQDTGIAISSSSYSQVFRTDNKGESWVEIQSDSFSILGFKKIEVVDEDVFILTGKENVIMSSDLGLTWAAVEITNESGGKLSPVAITKLNNGKYRLLAGSSLYEGQDLQNMTQLAQATAVPYLFHVFQKNVGFAEGKAYFIGDNNSFFLLERTESDPVEPVSTLPTRNIQGIYGTKDMFLAVDFSEGIWRSTNAGKNWIKVTSEKMGELEDVTCVDSSCWAVGENLFYSNDEGISWVKKDDLEIQAIDCTDSGLCLGTGSDFGSSLGLTGPVVFVLR